MWDVEGGPAGLQQQQSAMLGRTSLEAVAAARGAVRVRNVGVLADLLADGHVIAVVRGSSEFGPRALGHRSLLADPSRGEIKDRMNRLKVREWWRPVAPMVAHEHMPMLFDDLAWSPYMSYAARLKPRFRSLLPAIAHFDGTARVQTVTRDQDSWLHALLMAVAARTGFAVLCNTSFNTRGKPILNELSEALMLLEKQVELDFLYVDGWLFRQAGKVGRGV